MFEGLTIEEIRAKCRVTIENLEIWLRRIIDQTLTPKYGLNYLMYKDSAGNFLFSRKMREAIEKRMDDEPGRYKSAIDATQLPDLITIITSQPLVYKENMGQVFFLMFPEGAHELRTFLNRLVAPRHALAHANPISLRQAEQVMCYSHDIIDSIKAYYSSKNMDEDYNVPTIIQFRDSFGNVVNKDQFSILRSFSFTDESKYYLRPSDSLTLEVEIDPSFAEDEYLVEWHVLSPGFKTVRGKKLSLEINNSNVGKQFSIECRVTSKKDWHAHGYFDDSLDVYYKVLPPPSN